MKPLHFSSLIWLHSTIFLCFSVLSHHLLDATHILWLISVLPQFPQFLRSSFYLCFSTLFFVHLEVRSGEFYYPSAYSVLFLDRSLYFITVLVPPVCSGIFHLRANLLTALRQTFSNFNGLPEERKLYPVFFTSNVKMKHWTNFQTENQQQFHNMTCTKKFLVPCKSCFPLSHTQTFMSLKRFQSAGLELRFTKLITWALMPYMWFLCKPTSTSCGICSALTVLSTCLDQWGTERKRKRRKKRFVLLSVSCISDILGTFCFLHSCVRFLQISLLYICGIRGVVYSNWGR